MLLYDNRDSSIDNVLYLQALSAVFAISLIWIPSCYDTSRHGYLDLRRDRFERRHSRVLRIRIAGVARPRCHRVACHRDARFQKWGVREPNPLVDRSRGWTAVQSSVGQLDPV